MRGGSRVAVRLELHLVGRPLLVARDQSEPLALPCCLSLCSTPNPLPSGHETTPSLGPNYGESGPKLARPYSTRAKQFLTPFSCSCQSTPPLRPVAKTSRCVHRHPRRVILRGASRGRQDVTPMPSDIVGSHTISGERLLLDLARHRPTDWYTRPAVCAAPEAPLSGQP